MTDLAFFFDPLGIGEECRVVVSVTTEAAIGCVAGGRVREVLLLARLDTVAATLEPLLDLLLEEAPTRVHTMVVG